MKKISVIALTGILLLSYCTRSNIKNTVPVIGTWKLISGTLIENGDTLVTDYTTKVSFIKIINETHFAFLEHDLNQGKDSTAVFVAGGGRYSLTDSVYTEHLEYCSDRAWEDNDFSFVVTVKNDTLIQQGLEIVEEAEINRLNIERYVRVN
ncbi:MAG: hypothetical protein JW830_10870 [Bacteroidales bacterium]|nr:hypothetical protein [Bacteroidales bacterium]